MQMLDQISAHAEGIKKDAAHEMATLEIGDEWRQGDVRLRRLPEDAFSRLHDRLELLADFDGQVAPGATLGSRHILDSIEGVTAYRLVGGTALDGPVVRIDRPRTLTHPEHGDCCNLPAGIYAFPGQRVFAEELRRTAD